MVPTDKLNKINTHTYIDTCKFHSILLIMVFFEMPSTYTLSVQTTTIFKYFFSRSS